LVCPDWAYRLIIRSHCSLDLEFLDMLSSLKVVKQITVSQIRKLLKDVVHGSLTERSVVGVIIKRESLEEQA